MAHCIVYFGDLAMLYHPLSVLSVLCSLASHCPRSGAPRAPLGRRDHEAHIGYRSGALGNSGLNISWHHDRPVQLHSRLNTRMRLTDGLYPVPKQSKVCHYCYCTHPCTYLFASSPW